MSRINLDLQALAAFLEVAQAASFRAAAERLHLSAPALSRRIARLEETLGVRLFERTTRKVTLTAAGRSFIEQARDALDALERAALGIREVSRQHTGLVTIACVPTATFSLIPRMLRLFSDRLPGVRFRLLDANESQVERHVIEGEADFGIGFLDRPLPEVDFTALAADPYVAAVHRSHPLAGRKRLLWEQLRGERLISVSRASGNRAYVDALLERNEQAGEVFLEVNRVSTVLSLTQARLGVGLVPRMAVPPDHPDLTTIALGGPAVQRTVGVMVRHGLPLKPVPQLALDLLLQAGFGGEG